jgi:hypothetical protein
MSRDGYRVPAQGGHGGARIRPGLGVTTVFGVRNYGRLSARLQTPALHTTLHTDAVRREAGNRLSAAERSTVVAPTDDEQQRYEHSQGRRNPRETALRVTYGDRYDEQNDPRDEEDDADGERRPQKALDSRQRCLVRAFAHRSQCSAGLAGADIGPSNITDAIGLTSSAYGSSPVRRAAGVGSGATGSMTSHRTLDASMSTATTVARLGDTIDQGT